MRNLITILLLSVGAFAQGGFYQDRAEGRLINGNALVAIPGAAVTVCSDQACASPVNIYSNADLAVGHLIGTSTTADANGNFSFYVLPGQYFCQVAATGFSTAINPCQVSITLPNAVDTLSNQTISGNKTLSGQNSLTAYNLDNILFVDGVKYLTVSDAYNALPSCTIGSNTYAHCGEVHFNGSLPSMTSTLAITGPVRISGGDGESNAINCNINGPCITIGMTPFSTVHGAVLENFTINNSNAGTSVVGIQAGGVTEPVFRNLHFRGFGASQIQMLWNNPAATFSERVVLDHVHFDSPTTSATCLKFTDTNAANDFFYWRVLNSECNVGPGGTAVDLENDSQVVGALWNMTVNTDVNTATATTVFAINGTSNFGAGPLANASPLANQVLIAVDNSGLTNPVTLWSEAAGASAWISGQIIGTNGSVYSNSISGAFHYLLNNTFPGSATSNFTDLDVLAHTFGGNPANTYTWHYQNPAASRTITVNDPGANVYLPLTVNPLILNTAPTIASGFGTSPSIVNSNGTAVFEVNVGTGGSATSGVITLPAATTGWGCVIQDMNTNIANRESAFTTTSITITAASAWTASDKLIVQCEAF